MRPHNLALATILVAACASPSLAQTKDSSATPATQNQQAKQNQQTRAGGAPINYITARNANMWKASELIGKDVYGANNEDIGEVGDVLINRNGQVAGLVVDVGGFLGLGETHVAVPLHALQFQNQAQARRDQTPGTARDTTTTGTAADGRNVADKGRTDAAASLDPERIVLIVTKAQLEAAPKFKDDNASAAGDNNMSKGGSERR